MDEREFLDLIYAQWSKTTGAEKEFWGVEESHLVGYGDNRTQLFYVYAMDDSQEKKEIASGLSEEDADFIAGVHGCLPDLTRRMHDALDEADRLDRERDDQESAIAKLEIDADKLLSQNLRLSYRVRELEQEAQEADSYFEGLAAENTELERKLAAAEDKIETLRADVSFYKHQPRSDW